MRLTKALVGKEIRVTWRDPCSFDVEGADMDFLLSKLRGGREILPTWTERGEVLGVDDNVLVLDHASSRSSPLKDAASNQARVQGSLIPGDLIEHITILEAKIEIDEAAE